MLTSRVFLHFLGIHFLKEHGINYQYNAILNEADLAFRFGLLCSGEVYITAASYIESPLCFRIVNPFNDFFSFGLIHLVGGAHSLEEFIYNKGIQYNSNIYQKNSYNSISINKIPSYKSKLSSTTEFLCSEWLKMLSDGTVVKELETQRYKPASYIEERWLQVPSQLEDKAFIVDNIRLLLFGDTNNLHEINTLNRIINRLYFHSYTRELQAGLIVNLLHLDSPYYVQNYAPNIPYKEILQITRKYGYLLRKIRFATPSELLAIRDSSVWKNVLAEIENTMQTSSSTNLHKNRKDNQSMEIKERLIIVVLIALDEEFREFLDIANDYGKAILSKSISNGQYYYEFEVLNKTTKNPISIVAKLIGDMGPEIAASATSAVLSDMSPSLIVSLGISASLSSDIGLCDVAVANQIDSYGANLKAGPSSTQDKFELKHRGNVYRTPHVLLEEVANFEFAHSKDFAIWGEQCKNDCLNCSISSNSPVCTIVGPPRTHRVHLASGPFLGASNAFREWVQLRDGTLKVLDMEAAGIVSVASNRVKPIPLLAIKGISDRGDENKAELDLSSKQIFRKISMRNATRYMFALATCVNLSPNVN